MKHDNTFQESLDNLNSEQREAVDAIEGPVMVMAGPGTGKTQVLTLRIANIIDKTDTEPDSILALTFTESAASNMKKRLASLIGSRAYYVNINTFHGFCLEVIGEYPEYFEHIIGARNIDKIKQIEIIESILEKGSFEYIRPIGDKNYYVKDLIFEISSLKKDGVTPESFKELVSKARDDFYNREDLYNAEKIKTKYLSEEKKILRSLELVEVYKKYQDNLRGKSLIDFEDMILETISAFQKSSDFLLQIQEKYQYILVDEYQDTNGAQNMIVELLGGFYSSPNVFVVGDSRQAIYKFQGASAENFLFFKEKYEDSKLVSLKTSYRSGQSILDASHSLLSSNKSYEKLEAYKNIEAEIHQGHFERREAEIYYIARSIKKYIEDGVNLNEIAILYRENKEAVDIYKILQSEGIKSVVESDFNILEEEVIGKIILLMEVIYNMKDTAKMVEILHADFFDIEPIDIYKVLRVSREEKKSMIEVMDDKKLMEEKGINGFENVYEAWQKLQSLRKKSFNESFILFFERALYDSGIIESIIHKNSYEKDIQSIKTLIGAIEVQISSLVNYKVKDFLDYINLLQEHGVSLNTSYKGEKDAVRLMTAHKAKGLEFEVVYVTGLNDKKWGNKRKVQLFLSLKNESKEEKDEEEKRLFFMALTRAKKYLYLTGFLKGEAKEFVPSKFLYEIDQKFINKIDTDISYEEKVIEPQSDKLDQKDLKVFLRDIFTEQGLSATALNNYLECPWRFFYLNLIKIPQVKTIQLGLGQAVHSALHSFFEGYKDGKEVSKKFLIDSFKNSLNNIYFSEKDIERIKDKGIKMLESYYDNYKDNFNYHTLNEIRIEGNLEEDIKLNGIIDKIEFLPNSNEVLVVDYKTGKPKSRNVIEGNTKDSDGNYKRQLLFYSLLMDMKFSNYRVSQFVLDFVESNTRGIFKRESFIIEQEEKSQIREVIKKSWEDITQFNFWEKRCNKKDCEWCKLRNSIKK